MTKLFNPSRLAGALVLAAVALFGPAVSAHDYKLGELHIDHPWARATPHGAKVAGGFVAVANKGAADDRLVSATAEIAEHAEIHEMSMKDGVMTMRPLADGVVVPAGSELALKPGGYHLMFIGLKRMLKPGESFAGTLTFEKAGTVEVSFTVAPIGAGHGGHN
ncbi:copper chaperone PCu(A)C [Thalassobaculum sp.]|uniref:copper chaperone PCu(A)C n=1 Tax=Thalassobaculum sp. TaxID=2022740 RepID=UPI0032EB2590